MKITELTIQPTQTVFGGIQPGKAFMLVPTDFNKDIYNRFFIKISNESVLVFLEGNGCNNMGTIVNIERFHGNLTTESYIQVKKIIEIVYHG